MIRIVVIVMMMMMMMMMVQGYLNGKQLYGGLGFSRYHHMSDNVLIYDLPLQGH